MSVMPGRGSMGEPRKMSAAMVHANRDVAPTKKCDGDNVARQSWRVGDPSRPPLTRQHCTRCSQPAHPSKVFVLLLPPSLRQALKRWVAAAKEIFLCWETV